MHQVLTIIEENDNEEVNIEDKLFIIIVIFDILVSNKKKIFG